MSKAGIKESISQVQSELHRLESEGKMLTEEYKEFLDLQERLLRICPASKERNKIDPNTVVDVAGKLAISVLMFVFEREGVITTKVPIPSFALFRK